ncbi:MAG: SPFH domain-containing protein [Chloroflexi bacterium]|nr:SPFH domain-containing protein [Chloroflexota bacterium]
MFGIHYIKAAPTQYVFHFTRGRKIRGGAGLAFFYYKPTSSIVIVPIGSGDAPFIFNELSQDFQPLTVQGELTYRIQNPELVSTLLNFTIDGQPSRYVSDDPQKLSQRLINLLQVLVRAEVQRLPLRQVIHSSEAIASAVLEKFKGSDSLQALGVEVMALSIQGIKGAPEVARALESEAREDLMRRADQAIYDRRNASVEQERRIKENELNTEIAVEEKKRQIRQTKVEADLAVEKKQQEVRQLELSGQIDLEKERKQLVTTRSENARAEADVQAYALEASLKAFKGMDQAVLQMLAVQSADPRLMVSLAFKEIAQNAGKIGTLNVTPELLETLMREQHKSPTPRETKKASEA